MVMEAPVLISTFSGLNLDDPTSALDESELSECINLNVGKGGQLTKRYGYDLEGDLGLNDLIILGYYRTSGVNRLVLVSNDGTNSTVYFIGNSSTDTVTVSSSLIKSGLQYADNFYLIGHDSPQIIEVDSSFVDTSIFSTAGQGSTFATIHKDRMFINRNQFKDRVYFSDIGDPGTYQSDAFIDVAQGDGDEITGLVVLDDKLIIFKKRSVWAFYVQGDPSTWVLQNLTYELGCVSRHGYLQFEGAVYFISNESIYYTDGVSFQSLSVPIEQFFQDRPMFTELDHLVEWDYKLIAKCHDTASTYRIFVYSFRSNAWTEWTLAKEPSSFFVCLYDDPGQGLYFTSGNEYFKFEPDSFVDEGVFFECSFSTKDFDFGQPTVMKRGKWCGLDAQGQGVTILEHFVDNILQSPGLTTFPVETRKISKLRGPGYFRTWRFRISLSHENEFKFYGLTLYLAPKRKVIGSLT